MYDDYVDAGFNVYYLSGDAGFGAPDNKDGKNWKNPRETWTEYLAKGYYEKAAAVADKIVFTDYYFYRMIEAYNGSRADGGQLIGSGAYDMFSTQAALEAAVKARLQTYYQAENFYGLILRDEPTYKHFTTYGLVYKAIKKAAAELGMDYIYIHCNLLPMTTGLSAASSNFDPSYDGVTVGLKEAYTSYIEGFITATGCDRLSVDEYPFRTAPTNFRIGYYSGLQLLAEICKTNGVELTYIMQCCGRTTDNPYSEMTLGDMYLQVYSSLGFGVSNLGFYTFTQGTVNQNDSYCMVDNEGNLNPSYTYAQTVLLEVLAMDDVLLSYEYQGANIVNADKYATQYLDTNVNGYFGFDNTYAFNQLESVSVAEEDGEPVLVTEGKDEENGLYMYMIQNAIADCYVGEGANQEDGTAVVTLNFGNTTCIAVYEGGELRYENILDGTFSVTLENGRAIFIIPLN